MDLKTIKPKETSAVIYEKYAERLLADRVWPWLFYKMA